MLGHLYQPIGIFGHQPISGAVLQVIIVSPYIARKKSNNTQGIYSTSPTALSFKLQLVLIPT